jgi:hypothetical protein
MPTVIGPLGPIFTVIVLIAVVAVAVVIRLRRELRARCEAAPHSSSDGQREPRRRAS